jgi:drug/metabolite transporter (DMT)-like permease
MAIALVLGSVLLYGIWGTLNKVALRHLTWPQVSIFYGLAIIVVVGVILATTARRDSWSGHGLWIAVLTGFLGACGLVALYLALDRGSASIVFPLFALFPAVTVVLSVFFLDERISPVQIAGVACAVLATVLVSVG